ncbi:MAG: UDP-N-acetylglucosamine--N-acetylmuramyl-(pentapeptide) pyrophosphoryl-undecaprenol N-acetylglucosamine transferase [Parcubacteria group bacterium]
MDREKKEIKIMLAGGGTAGHINPLLAVCSEAKNIADKKGLILRLVYVGNPGDYADKFEELGITIRKIIPSKLRRYFSVENFLEAPKFILSLVQSMMLVFKEKPDVIFGKGGPGSLAPIIAGRIFSLPVVIHESDSVPSITTRISARFARKIFLAFEDAKDDLRDKDRKKSEVVGNPLRPIVFENLPDKRAAKLSLGFNPEKLLAVVIGGSQGSQRMNDLVVSSVSEMLGMGLQIFHQTGAKSFAEVSGAIGNLFDSPEEMNSSGYRMTDFIDRDIKEVFAAADIFISRAGSSIFEFAALGKPSILIPLPEAAQNHQLKNALAYERAKACIVLREEELNPSIFLRVLGELISKTSLLESMAASAKEFAKPDAARKIAEKLVELARG